ncbi:MAG: chemotaxis protein CheB [Kofleriaceae bacterium]
MRVVVIGGSAGALEALHELFAEIPEQVVRDAPAAFAIVVHISPTSESLLATVVGAYTSMRVREAVDKLPLEPGSVVVAPPDYHMLIERDHTIALSRDRPEHFSRPAIDPLFDSAAVSIGADAIGVLLSGSNTDGAAGLAALAGARAKVCVQHPDSAASPEMPRAGIAACAPDLIDRPSALGRWICWQLGGRP